MSLFPGTAKAAAATTATTTTTTTPCRFFFLCLSRDVSGADNTVHVQVELTSGTNYRVTVTSFNGKSHFSGLARYWSGFLLFRSKNCSCLLTNVRTILSCPCYTHARTNYTFLSSLKEKKTCPFGQSKGKKWKDEACSLRSPVAAVFWRIIGGPNRFRRKPVLD